MKRHNFIKASLAAGATLAVPKFLAELKVNAVQSVFLENKLDPMKPLPDSGDLLFRAFYELG